MIHRLTLLQQPTYKGAVQACTWVVVQGVPTELSDGSSLRFGASTRLYRLHEGVVPSRKRPLDAPAAAVPSGSTAGQPRGRVRFANADDGAEALEQVIGYSDGRSFSVNVGPTANDGALKGQFVDLVKPRTLEASIENKNADQVDGIKPGVRRRDSTQVEKRQRRVQPLLPPSSSGLYDLLPSPASRLASEPVQ